MSTQSLNQATLIQESLRRLGEEGGLLSRAAQVLALVSVTHGLGEVLRDFAHQACGQLHEIMMAARESANGQVGAEQSEILQQAHIIIKSAKTVLDMTPVAMQRNRADAIGDTQKLPRSEVVQIAHEFKQSADITLLLDMEQADAMNSYLSLASAEPAPVVADVAVAAARLARH